MKTHTILIVSIALQLTAFYAKAAGPLSVTTPSDWTVKFDDAKGVQFYTVKKTDTKHLVLMFSRWPASNDPTQIPSGVEKMALTFVGLAKTNPDLKGVDPNYKSQEIKGNSFKGNLVRFTSTEDILVMFMISDGDGIWNGQYSGPESEWEEALQILTNLKRQG